MAQIFLTNFLFNQMIFFSEVFPNNEYTHGTICFIVEMYQTLE